MVYKYHCKMEYTMFEKHMYSLSTHSYGDTVKSTDSLFKIFTSIDVNVSFALKFDYITNTPIFEIPILLRKHVLDDKYLDHMLYINYDKDNFELFVNTVINYKIKGGGRLVVADMRESKATIAVITVDSRKKILERKDSVHVITDRCCRDYLVEKGFIEKVSYRGIEYYETTLYIEKTIRFRRYPVRMFFDTKTLSIVERF